MNKISILIITIIISINLYSQTPISGNQSGTWTLSNSPYEVMGALTVPTGQTLIIEAGVEINFKGHYKFNVDGKILATGTETEGIIFTTDNQATGWGGVRLDGTPDISIFTFCTFEYGKTSTGDYPDNVGGAFLLKDSNAEFYNCRFLNNDATGADNGIGGAVYAFNTGSSTTSLTRFIDCQFLNNHAYGEGGAIRLTNDGHSEIKNCQFVGNNAGYGGGAIHVFSALNTSVTNCLFHNNTANNSGGGAIKTMNPSVTMAFTNCTFAYNNAWGAGEGGAIDLSYSDITMVNSIVFGNTQTYGGEINIGMNASAEINYSDLVMPEDATGANNINSDPLFIDASNGYFNLQRTSPCIDAGTDVGLPYAGSAPDMGSIEYGLGISVADYGAVDFTVYPNPSNGLIQINSESKIKSIQLINSLGKVVLEKNLNGEKSTFIDTSIFVNATYFLSIYTLDNHRVIRKLVL